MEKLIGIKYANVSMSVFVLKSGVILKPRASIQAKNYKKNFSQEDSGLPGNHRNLNI